MWWEWEKHKEQKETTNQMNMYFEELIHFLTPLQIWIRKYLSIDTNGRIDRSQLTSIYKNIETDTYIKNLHTQALGYYNDAKSEFTWCNDMVIILWALVYTYDSSQVIPKWFIWKNRWDHKPIFYNGSYISLISIDLNIKERNDTVSPTISLHHELQHHLNTTLWDQYITKNKNMHFLSANRNADPPRWFQSKSQFIASEETVIWNLFWRSINLQSNSPIHKTQDYLNYENQLYYLDELSASFWQAKNNIWWPNQLFYNNKIHGEKTHYELIGNYPQDKEDLKNIFQKYLMPGLYLFELKKLLAQSIEKEKLKLSNDTLENSIKSAKINDCERKIESINTMIAFITQTLWIARSIHQALQLLDIIWVKKIEPHLSNDYKNYIFGWAKNLTHLL